MSLPPGRRKDGDKLSVTFFFERSPSRARTAKVASPMSPHIIVLSKSKTTGRFSPDPFLISFSRPSRVFSVQPPGFSSGNDFLPLLPVLAATQLAPFCPALRNKSITHRQREEPHQIVAQNASATR